MTCTSYFSAGSQGGPGPPAGNPGGRGGRVCPLLRWAPGKPEDPAGVAFPAVPALDYAFGPEPGPRFGLRPLRAFNKREGEP